MVGSKCDHRYEKKLDFISKKKQKVAVIQRGWRGYRGRKKAWERRQMLSAVRIQKNARMFLAVKEKKRLKIERCCRYVQIAVRRILALKEVERRVGERKQESRIFVALRMQSYYRRRVA